MGELNKNGKKGRPRKLTSDWLKRNGKKLADALASGDPPEFACVNLKDPIARRTFYLWRQAGAEILMTEAEEWSEEEDRSVKFLLLTQRALAKYEKQNRLAALGKVESDVPWTAFMTILERRFPRLYAIKGMLTKQRLKDLSEEEEEEAKGSLTEMLNRLEDD